MILLRVAPMTDAPDGAGDLTPLSGVVCPMCGRRNLAAAFVRHRGHSTIRVRQCRNRACGHRIRTVERISGVATQRPPLPANPPPPDRHPAA